MGADNEARSLAECTHAMALPFGDVVKRCPHCGAMRVRNGPWALPHLVDAFVRAWKEAQKGTS